MKGVRFVFGALLILAGMLIATTSGVCVLMLSATGSEEPGASIWFLLVPILFGVALIGGGVALIVSSTRDGKRED